MPGTLGFMTNCATLKCPSPRGERMCHCAGCHLTFASPSAFDDHQTITNGPACRDPEACGLVLRERSGISIWGHPIDEAAMARLAARRMASSGLS